jgi:hypothetical protein
MSKVGKNQQNGRAFTKTVKVQAKLSSTRTAPIEYVPDKRLKGAVIFTVHTGGGLSRQMVCHHPIGITDLNGNDWVVSDISDINHLLRTKDDPGFEKLRAQRGMFKFAVIARNCPDLLYFGEDGVVYYHEDTVPRSERISAARLAEKNANQGDKNWKKTSNSYMVHLSPYNMSIERKIRIHLKDKDLNEKAEESYPQTYRMCYARGYQNEQKGAVAFSDCKDSCNVYKRIISMVENFDKVKISNNAIDSTKDVMSKAKGITLSKIEVESSDESKTDDYDSTDQQQPPKETDVDAPALTGKSPAKEGKVSKE